MQQESSQPAAVNAVTLKLSKQCPTYLRACRSIDKTCMQVKRSAHSTSKHHLPTSPSATAGEHWQVTTYAEPTPPRWHHCQPASGYGCSDYMHVNHQHVSPVDVQQERQSAGRGPCHTTQEAVAGVNRYRGTGTMLLEQPRCERRLPRDPLARTLLPTSTAR